MQITSEHRITFEYVDTGISIPDIINPVYIYKVGDTFTFHDILLETVKKFEVTDIKQELENMSIVAEQRIVVYIKEIKDVN
jgi:hypothetical protein